jgi:hypothetical protein
MAGRSKCKDGQAPGSTTRNEAATKAILLGLGPDKRLGALMVGFDVIYDFFDRNLKRCVCALGLAKCLCKA